MDTTETPQSGDRSAIGIIAIAALAWGLFWIPLQALEGAGLAAPWSAVALLAAAFVVSLPLIFVEPLSRPHWKQLCGAVGIGIAISLYSLALGYSDIVRVVLLFYFAPAWSLLIECFAFGRRWTWAATVALLCSFAGIICVVRGEVPLDGLGAVGDWMALVAGLAWAIGAALIFSRDEPVSFFKLARWSLGGALAAAVALVVLTGTPSSTELVTGGPPGAAGDIGTIAGVALLALALGGLYLVPVLIASLWGAAKLAPATMSFLLTGEIVSGVASSALFAEGQVFGWPEAIGTALIIAGALIEIVWSGFQRRRNEKEVASVS